MIFKSFSAIVKGFLHQRHSSYCKSNSTYVKDKIVISGVVGRFTGNTTLDEFYNVLRMGLATADGTSSSPCPDMSPRYVACGRGAMVDPVELIRMAIIDAGVNPCTLRGTNTGIYHMIEPVHGANGIARHASGKLSFKGPTVSFNLYSGVVPLEVACRAITAGDCDSAVILDQKFQGSNDGEAACVAMYICRESVARRVYAEIKGTAVNGTGLGNYGIEHDAAESKQSLYLRAYARADVKPKVISLLCHNPQIATGNESTRDTAKNSEVFEVIDKVFYEGRRVRHPLNVSALGCNDEKLPGLSPIAVMILSHINGTLPGSSLSVVRCDDFETKRSCMGKEWKVNAPWPGDIVAISDFRSSSNGHVILSFEKIERQREFFPSDLPILIPFAARYPKILDRILPVVANSSDHGMVALMHNLIKQHLRGHAFRGYALNHPSLSSKNEVVTDAPLRRDSDPRILFVMTGTGSHWPGMGRGLLRLPVFAESIQRADKLLEGKFQLSKHIHAGELGEDKYCVPLMVTCIQLGLVDLMHSLAIQPTVIIGYSTGEIAGAYADGCLSFEETLALAFARSDSLREARISGGGMAAVDLSWEQAMQRVPEGVVLACNNAENNVTVSGCAERVHRFVGHMKNQGVHAVLVDTEGIAYHSDYMEPAMVRYKERLKDIFGDKKMTQKNWISASMADPAEVKGKELSVVEYFVNKMRSPVRFKRALDLVPKNSIVVELGPHSLLQTLLSRKFKKVRVVGLTNKRAEDQVFHFLQSAGKLYNAGANPDLSMVYPVNFPLRCRTPNLSSLIQC